MIKGVIFDLDGTTINTLNELYISINQTLKEYGYPTKTLDEVRMGVGRGFRKLVEAVVPEKLDEEKLTEIGRSYQKAYTENYLKSDVYPGMTDLLKELQERGIRLVVNSNKSDRFTKALIAKNYPDIRFTAVYGGREGFPMKPDPTVAKQIAEQMGLEIKEVLYVGDSDVDIQTGRNAGMKTAGCLWGFRDRETLANAGADHILEKPEDLLKLL
ncbi:MAG: HAD family hydrolase [Erysipelotrichaceae bacterium]|nr:HAD family hydrolase [Erysipelotrichaceae bacterium]